MKRMILIVAIALLPVLSACFIGKRPHCNCPTTTALKPVVGKLGTLRNLELKYGKGKRLFKKPIQEGIYVFYRIGNGKPHAFYAIGDKVSDPKVSYSGYQEEISGAGITSEDGLNVTTQISVDGIFGTVSMIRTFVNRLENETMYLSEIKNYGDANILPLGTYAGPPTKVERFPKVTGEAKPALALNTVKDKDQEPVPPIQQKWTDNCWPCEPPPGEQPPSCQLATLVRDPMMATLVCVSCKKDVPGYVHTVCLADLNTEIERYRKDGCEYWVTFTGIRDTRSKVDSTCTIVEPQLTRFTSGAAARATGRAPFEGTLGKLLTIGPTETSQGPPDETLEKFLTLPPKGAVVLITVYKINATWE
jgi:hypothetical protein